MLYKFFSVLDQCYCQHEDKETQRDDISWHLWSGLRMMISTNLEFNEIYDSSDKELKEA